MKCFQNSCQRNKNLLANGYCNVCNEAVAQVTNKLNERINKAKFKEVDVQDLVKVHDKLKNGTKVDQNSVNAIIIDGLIKLIAGHDTIKHELEVKIETMEANIKTKECRIESLENWVNKQDETIKNISNQMREGHADFEVLKENVANLEVKIKKTDQEQEQPRTEKKCNLCSDTFSLNSDLESHMTRNHQAAKTFKCAKCNKSFHLKWRLEKHQEIHNPENTEGLKHCHYFNNGKTCPYEEIGCQFLHMKSKECRFDNCRNKLCPFTHIDDISVPEDENEEENEEPLELSENQCHICRKQFLSKNDQIDHVSIDHEEYYKGMMELVAGLNNS